MTTEWQNAVRPPKPSVRPEDHYGAWTDSPLVLVLQLGGRMTVARYQWHPKEDMEMNKWIEGGRDGYEVTDVTHWMPLPDTPYPKAHASMTLGELANRYRSKPPYDAKCLGKSEKCPGTTKLGPRFLVNGRWVCAQCARAAAMEQDGVE